MKTPSILLAAMLLAPACATPEKAEPKPLTPLSALPERERDAWAAWLTGGAAWETQIESVRADPALARFVVENLVRVMVQSYGRSQLAAAHEGAPGPFERASADLVELGEHSAPVLVELLRAPDGVIALLAADRLRAIGARAAPLVPTLLEDEREETRRRACELLADLAADPSDERGLQEALAVRLERDPAWTVRAQAALALGARAERTSDLPSRNLALKTLSRALSDQDPGVSARAARALGTLGDRDAIVPLARAFERATAAGDLAFGRELESALSALAGDRVRRTPAEWLRFQPAPHGKRGG